MSHNNNQRDGEGTRTIHLDFGDVQLDELHAHAAAEIEAMTGEDIEDVLVALIKPQLTGGRGGVPSQVDNVIYGLRQVLMNDAGDPSSRSLEELRELAGHVTDGGR